MCRSVYTNMCSARFTEREKRDAVLRDGQIVQRERGKKCETIQQADFTSDVYMEN